MKKEVSEEMQNIELDFDPFLKEKLVMRARNTALTRTITETDVNIEQKC